MKNSFLLLAMFGSFCATGQTLQNINKSTSTVSNAITDIDSIRFNESSASMEVVLQNGTVESHSIADIVNVKFAPAGSNSCGVPDVHNTAKTYGSMNDQQGNVYKTIVIGSQEWMAENLKTDRYRSGDAIPRITSNGTWSSLNSGATCWMNNDSSANACAYGRIYNRFAVVDPRGLCPAGWHVPSDAEFSTLATNLGGTDSAGGKMKSTSALWQSPNTGASNSSGFSALPGGSRQFNDGSFSAPGAGAYWWSSTNFISNLNYYYALLPNDAAFLRDFVDENYGFSVRCVKD
jgi:uncharacterized protein (TIGR02145 family)